MALNTQLVGTAAEILASLRRKGVTLYVEGGELRYRAPKGVLTDEERGIVIAARGPILALLEQPKNNTPHVMPISPRQKGDVVPLTYSQMDYWESCSLATKCSARTVVVATRLQGELDVGRLRVAIGDVVRRHEALRTKIAISTGTPVQMIDDSGEYDWEFEDLFQVCQDAQEAATIQIVQEFLSEPISVIEDRLFAACLIKIDANHHVLSLTMDHIISDAFSARILSRDFLTAYKQLGECGASSLPPVAVQFPDYAVWLKKTHAARQTNEIEYWKNRLRYCGRIRFPQMQMSSKGPGKALSISFTIDSNLRMRLVTWCRLNHTTIVLAVLTAYVALVMRWCNLSDAVFLYQSDGRFHRNVEDTIGYFASILHLRLQLGTGDSLIDLLHRTTQEQCSAFEHNDHCYVAKRLRFECSNNPGFNWVPFAVNGLMADRISIDDRLTQAHVPITVSPREGYELELQPQAFFRDFGTEVIGDIYFSKNRFTAATMERFKCDLLTLIEALVVEPGQCVKDVTLSQPS